MGTAFKRLNHFFLRGGLLLAANLAANTFAGRPLTIDDAEPVALRQFEFEAGVRYNADHVIEHYDFPLGLTCGLLPGLELGIGSGGQIEEREEVEEGRRVVTDMGDLTLGAKYKLLDAQRWWANHALAFTVKFPTAGHHNGMGTGKTDYDVTWIVSKTMSEPWGAHLNVGFTWLGDHPHETHDDIVHYGVAVDHQLTRAIQLVAELYANTPVTGDLDTASVLSGGLRWQVNESLIFDAALGAGLSDGAPAIISTLGLTWSFGPR